MRNPARLAVALGLLGAAAALPAPALAATSKAKLGYYADNATNRNMTLNVARNLKKLSVFQVACLNSAGRQGGVIVARNVPISDRGTFRIDGNVSVTTGSSRFTTKMLITGAFQANRVVGSSVARGRTCGTVRFNGRYYGNAQG
ncbi:hypothetical protein VSS74_11355 [Conexibacter stalactiti]|uniref:DUF5666 domain-containing protein n=1 Tax=Conexibacter stalactiti TaxID=1940611 RepID=A0ABU4HNR1_9ACTN|nr:hypothetical protein [Conexibacter stalactiti]MDW5594940.1 hypothetical protein [Conexibacter stalactiti]MEC5035582.1 hypothetical protein [Conexibacter stalactiti]